MGLIAYDRQLGEFASLRHRLDRFLARYGEDYPFMYAFDGALLYSEERNEEARARFAKCLATQSGNESADAQYISLFCLFSLNVRDKQNRNSARKEASKLKVDSTIRWFLKFPPEETIKRIEHEARGQVETEKEKRKSVEVSIDF